MKAAYYRKQGAADEVIEIGELPAPEPGPGEVRVRLAYSGVNPSDTKARGGFREQPFDLVIPHSDGSGVIDRVGSGVPESRVGERVWTYEAQWQRPFGTAAEYVTLPSSRAVTLPGPLSLRDGACLGIPAMTAWWALNADGPIAGKNVIVSGAAGRVGLFVVQMARLSGARVIATARGDGVGRAYEAGADAVLDFSEPELELRLREEIGEGADRIVDAEIGVNLDMWIRLSRPHSGIVGYASMANPRPAFDFYTALYKNLTIRPILVYTIPEWAKDQACHFIAAHAGDLSCRVSETFDLESVAAAHDSVDAGRLAGGAVLIELPPNDE